MLPEVPGVISLHAAPWLSEHLPYTSWLHTTDTQKSLISLSACASLEFPHCCAQHTRMRWAFAESQFCWEEDWRTSSLPTTEGSAQAFTWRIKNLWPERRQPELLVIFLERSKNLGGTFGWRFKLKDLEYRTGILLVAWVRPSNRWLHAHVEDLALTDVQYINDLNGSRKNTKTIS